MKKIEDFDKSFDHTLKRFWIIWTVVLALMLGLVGFTVWVIIELLRFFGVM